MGESHPCHITILNADIESNFSTASENLKKDGFEHCLHKRSNEIPQSIADEHLDLTNVDQWKIVKIVNKFMMKFDHRLNNGNIYSKPEKGTN